MRVWTNRKSHTFLVRVQIDTLENSLAVCIYLQIPCLHVTAQEKYRMCVHDVSWRNVYSSFVQAEIGKAYIFTRIMVDKQTVIDKFL